MILDMDLLTINILKLKFFSHIPWIYHKLEDPLQKCVEKHQCNIMLSCSRQILDNYVFNISTCTHYKENTKKWLGFLTKSGGKVNRWLTSFLVRNLVMSDKSFQTKWLQSYRTGFVPNEAFPIRFCP